MDFELEKEYPHNNQVRVVILYNAMVIGESSNDPLRIENNEEITYSLGELKIEEHKFSDYECPKFILLEEEEKRIPVPWQKGVIVKMLGIHIH